MVKFENRENWADLENRSKVVHSKNFPIWRPASGHRDHVTSHVTHWGQWKYASRSWHAVGNHRRQLKLMYRSKISGRGPKHCSGSKFQCSPRPVYVESKLGTNMWNTFGCIALHYVAQQLGILHFYGMTEGCHVTGKECVSWEMCSPWLPLFTSTCGCWNCHVSSRE